MAQKKIDKFSAPNNTNPGQLNAAASLQNEPNGSPANISNSKVNGTLLNSIIDKSVIENNNLFFQFYDDSEGFTPIDFVDIMYKFDSYKPIQYGKSHKELILDELLQQSKSSYGNNLKLGGLRLGQNILFISKNKAYNIFNVGLISSNNRVNPNMQECVIFLFSMDMKNKKYETESGDQNKRIILNNISNLMNEEQLFKHDKGNYVYIFDLKRIPGVTQEGYEFSYNPYRPDVVVRKKTFFKEKKEQVERLIDYSLKSYIQHMYVKVPENLHFMINGHRYEFLAYQDILRKQKGMRFLKELNVETNPILKELGKVTIYEQINYNVDNSTGSTSQAQSTLSPSNELVEMQIDANCGTTTRKNTSAEYHQGILIYADERLLGRAESTRFGSGFIDKILNKTKHSSMLFKTVGVIELEKFFVPNLFHTGIESTFLEGTMRQCLKQYLREKQPQQKAEKTNHPRSSENFDEPELRKEIKID